MNKIGHGTAWRKGYEQREAMVGMYLDKYLYPNISIDFERVTATELQKRGIDVSLSGSSRVITIDEKATMNWVGTNLQKAALELRLNTIDEHNNEYEINGWLLSHGLNTHIEIIWIDGAKDNEGRFLTTSAITDCTCAIIDKQKVMDELESLGWSESKLRTKADRIRQSFNIHGDDYWRYENCGDLSKDGVHFFIQTQEPEHAVNVQLSRERLINISDYACRIMDNKLLEIKRL